MGQLDVIDVTVVGGPDVAARVTTSLHDGGRRVDIDLAANATVPAVVERVGIVIEAPSIRRLVAHGWLGGDGARRLRTPGSTTATAVTGPRLPAGTARPGDAVSHQLVVTDGATVGWMGVGRHPGVVVVQRDGWLLTAWALLGGLILAPGETASLDPLWLGSGDVGPSMVGFASAWAADAAVAGAPPGRVALPGAVWLAPRSPGSALDAGPVHAAAPVLADLGLRAAVLDARWAPGTTGGDPVSDADDLRRIVERARSAGLQAGIVVEPGAGLTPSDLSTPGTADRLTSLGAAIRAAGIDYVVVDRCAPTLSADARWGDASITAQGALRVALEALRAGLGPDPVIHLRDAPLGVAPGVADVVECTAGDGPATTLPSAAVEAALRSPLQGRLWASTTGPLDPSGWGAADSDAVGLLQATTSSVTLTGDPRRWGAAARAAVGGLVASRSPSVDDLEPWGPEVAVSGGGRRRSLTAP